THAAALEIAIPPGPRLGDVVVEADHVTKGYGDRVLIDDLSFKLPRGGIVGVIGPNGAGKTTLFRMIAGQEKPDSGTLRVGETVRRAEGIGHTATARVPEIATPLSGAPDRPPTHWPSCEAEGRAARHEGTNADTAAVRRRRRGAEADPPHQPKDQTSASLSRF